MSAQERDPNEIVGARRADLVELAKIIEDQTKLISGLRATKDLQRAAVVKVQAERDVLLARCEQLNQEKIALSRALVPSVN